MTVEELEIVVTAKVEEAVREVMKLAPAIKQVVKQAQDTFSKVDTKTMQNKFQQAVQFMKKKMQDLKKSTQNNEIAVKVTNKDAQKQISQVQKQIDSLQEKINARQMKLNVITPKLDEITSKTTKAVTPEGVSSDNSAIQQTIDNSLAKNKEYNSLITQEEKMTQEIAMYNKQLQEAKSKMAQLGKEAKQTGTNQEKMTSFFSAFKEKFSKIDTGKIFQAFSEIPKITTKISNHIKNMGAGIKNGISHVLKYAGALFSLRGIYSTLSNSANAWLSSQNAGAKQLSANINYMKYAMGSAFAPVIQWVTNLVYNLMKAIQSVVYALFRVNIFANASAKSYASMAGNAKKAKQETKQLAGIHDEINNIQNDSNTDSGSGGGGGATPSFDLSRIDNQMSPLAQKLYDFFKPLRESWDNYGAGLIEQVKTTAGQVAKLISSVWGSFEKIITNGTVYTTLELILAIIGNIAEAFANAWNYNGNGDAIVQNLANAFNNLLDAINNVVKSEWFQEWLNKCSDKFREISEKIASIDWQPLINALMEIGTKVGSVALEILSALVDIFKWLAENPTIAEIILAIAMAIGIVGTVLSVISAVMAVLNPILTATSITLAPLIGIIAGITAAIALIILAIMNWDTIMKALNDTWNWICEQAQIIWNAIAEFFTGLWKGICDTVTNIWNGIKDFFIGIWNAIVDFVVGIITGWIDFQKAKFEFLKNIVTTIFKAIKDFIVNVWNGIKNVISSVINAIKNTISNILNAIKTTWQNIWNGIKTFASNIWNGIKNVFSGVGSWFTNIFQKAYNGIRNVFSSIGSFFSGIWGNIKNTFSSLGTSIGNAISGAVKSGINGVISLIQNTINGAIRLINGGINLINLIPGVTIGHVSYLTLPRLAKGGVLTQETAFIGGEYSGASSNPEIVTPQNIMRDTVEEVFARHDNEKVINLGLTVNVGNERLGKILLEDLRNMKRRSGKDIEALVN